MGDKIVLIDGNSIINRAFYANPLLTTKEGIYVNGVFGFMNTLIKIVKEETPSHLAVAFDLHHPTFRHNLLDSYKGTRKEMPGELRPQMQLLKDLLDKLGIMRYELKGFEADDILGTLGKTAENMNFEVVIVSGDRDLLQVASDKIKIRIPKTKDGKAETIDYLASDVIDIFGVTPLEFIDVKALMGDSSDNIPGVPGIGEKTAIKIITDYKTIENAIDNYINIKPKKASENLNTYRDLAVLSKELATISLDIPINFEPNQCRIPTEMNSDGLELLKKLEFKTIIEKLSFLENPSVIEKDSSIVNTTLKSKLIDRESFSEFINEMKKENLISYMIYEENQTINAISFLTQNFEGYLLEFEGDFIIETCVDGLKEIFNNKEISLITHNAKNSLKALLSYGITNVTVAFDIMLAAYLLNPTKSGFTLDSIAMEYLNETHPSFDSVFGKGKSRIKYFELENNNRLNFCVNEAMLSLNLYPVMENLLKEREQTQLYYEIELPLIYVLLDMEVAGIKVHKEKLIEFGNDLDKHIDLLTKEIYDLADCKFNILSPKQLGEILFERLGLKATKKTKTGYSTDADVLDGLKDKHPIINKILDYRTMTKLKSTYVDGLLNVTSPETGKIYTTFNQTIAATGRLSSTEPNLQNIPIRTEIGRNLRKIFIPDSEELIFLDGDYSQIELRVLAHISGDDTLINGFINGLDIHRLTASQVYNTTYDDVTSEQRSNAKAVNFGIVYGISAFSLSKDIGVTTKEAQRYIDSYFNTYPKIKTYLDRSVEEAKATGYAKTIFNRKRPMPELFSSNFAVRSFGERAAMNMPIQGTAADIIKIAMLNLHKKLSGVSKESRLILQVHDELLVLAPKTHKEAVSELMKNEMQNAVKLLLPLEVDIHEGDSWYNAK